MLVLLYEMFACVFGVVTNQGQEMHCHAYHVLLNGGMPAENIIVMVKLNFSPLKNVSF
eukprot:UN12555